MPQSVSGVLSELLCWVLSLCTHKCLSACLCGSPIPLRHSKKKAFGGWICLGNNYKLHFSAWFFKCLLAYERL